MTLEATPPQVDAVANKGDAGRENFSLPIQIAKRAAKVPPVCPKR
jgi:hypothetical protein